MPGDAMHQHSEVRRTRGAGAWLGVLAVVALVVLLAWTGREDGEPDAAPSTTSPSTASTLPRRLPSLPVVADTDAGPRPATTADAPDPGAASSAFEAIQATPVATDGRIVLLVDGGDLLVGRPRGGFEALDLGAPSSALVASNEPGHVWVVAPGDELALIALDGSDPPVRIPLGGERVLGPAPFGVVTVAADGAVSWRRPSFDPVVLASTPGAVPVDAGGNAVLYEDPPPPGGGRSFTVRSVVDGVTVQVFGSSVAERAAVLAADGSTVALPHAAGWIVHDVASGDQRGSLPTAPGEPVWVGDSRFAVLVDGVVSLSDGATLSPPWRLRALAERSP